jgi:hypothetical protein
MVVSGGVTQALPFGVEADDWVVRHPPAEVSGTHSAHPIAR